MHLTTHIKLERCFVFWQTKPLDYEVQTLHVSAHILPFDTGRKPFTDPALEKVGQFIGKS